jgi:hypothetical protein
MTTGLFRICPVYTPCGINLLPPVRQQLIDFTRVLRRRVCVLKLSGEASLHKQPK